MKLCSKCPAEKSLDEFHYDSKSRDGRCYYCKSCANKASRDLHKHRMMHDPSYKESKRWDRIYHTYRLRQEDFWRMYTSQNSLCKICETKLPHNLKYIHIDHCHKNGTIRGLLCVNCNHMLGSAKDNINTLKSAIEYLINSAGKEGEGL